MGTCNGATATDIYTYLQCFSLCSVARVPLPPTLGRPEVDKRRERCKDTEIHAKYAYTTPRFP